jgi:hypothetical protein
MPNELCGLCYSAVKMLEIYHQDEPFEKRTTLVRQEFEDMMLGKECIEHLVCLPLLAIKVRQSQPPKNPL